MSHVPHCPRCETPLHGKGAGRFHCDACSIEYQQSVHCDVCAEEVETLKACGAVDYFCNKCNSLKSKSKVEYRYDEISH